MRRIMHPLSACGSLFLPVLTSELYYLPCTIHATQSLGCDPGGTYVVQYIRCTLRHAVTLLGEMHGMPGMRGTPSGQRETWQFLKFVPLKTGATGRDSSGDPLDKTLWAECRHFWSRRLILGRAMGGNLWARPHGRNHLGGIKNRLAHKAREGGTYT